MATVANRHLGYLDGWRGMAILLVLVGHFTPFSQAGALGVELFFVLSGRLMAEILFVQRQSLGTFARRRASRILPAFVAYVVIMAVVAWFKTPNADGLWIASSAAGALLFVSNYLMGYDTLAVFQHSWSLAVEEHSYLLLAALAALTTRDRRVAAAIAAGAAALAMVNGAWQYWNATDTTAIYAHTDVRAASIFGSFALWLRISEGDAPIPSRLGPWISPACLSAGIAIAMLSRSEALTFTVGTALLAVAVNKVDMSATWFRRALERPWLRYGGLLSFSLYLWQQPAHLAYLAGAGPLACLAPALLCGALSFYGIERPARSFLNAPQPRRDTLAALA